MESSLDLAKMRIIWDRLGDWAAERSRTLIWVSLFIAVLATLRTSVDAVYISADGVRTELKNKEDIHNLYYAAANASWRDVPRWWTGSWIYPDVGYYRPLTSILFLAEYRAFGRNFTAYNCVSLVLHHINIALLYLLTVSLFRPYKKTRAILGLVAAYFFATEANSMYFSIGRVLNWWPAQNDIMSLTFGLLCLLLLDRYLAVPKRGLLIGSILALFLAIASKEMGFITAPVALVLIAQRRMQGIGPWRAPLLSITSLTAFMWFFRRMVVPHHWGPVMFRRLIFERMMLAWLGPAALLARAGIIWPAAAGVAITTIVTLGLYKRWRAIWIAALSAATAVICAQFVGEDTTAVVLLFLPDQERLWSVLCYILAGALFIRYVKKEPALFTGLALWLVYLPILQYGGGKHYYYWPGAFNAIADAAFVVCLWRWVQELKTGANWELPTLLRKRHLTTGSTGDTGNGN